MTIHVAKDTGCNLGCEYCYQEANRDITENDVSSVSLDLDAVIGRLEELKGIYGENETPGMHGGEPLLVDIDDLEAIFSWVYDNYESVREGVKKSHIQTNGTMINDEHIRIFKEYNVNVGISCDGPLELNKGRKARFSDGSVATDKMTEKTINNIEKLAEDPDVTVSLIIVASKFNCETDEQIDILLEWLEELAQMGVWGHYNPAIPYDDIQTDVSPTVDELKNLYLRTWEWVKGEEYRKWDPMNSYVDNLLGSKLTNCVENRCDVFNSGAAKIVTGEGDLTGCGKPWSAVGDGIPFLQGPDSDQQYNDAEERYEMLKMAPGWTTEGEPDMGGCRGCKFWNLCQGGCPASGLDQDFRNRTIWCEAKYALYEQIERDLRTMFPNIRLITDYPWNAELSWKASTWELDIRPFAAMDPGEPGRSSSFAGFDHNQGGPLDIVDDIRKLMPDGLEQQWEFLEECVVSGLLPEEHVFIDRENRTWEVNSDRAEEEEEPTHVRLEDLVREDMA